MEEIIRQFKERCNELPSVVTFKCLIKKELLPEGVMPKWITKMINWTIEG